MPTKLPDDDILTVCDRIDAGTATPEDICTLSRWARYQSKWLAQIIQRGVEAAEARQ